MKKIETFIKTNFKEYLNKYLITNIIILISTLLMLFPSITKNTILIQILLISIAQVFTIEAFIKDKKKKWIFIALVTIISTIISIIEKRIGLSLRVKEIVGTYLVSVFLVGIYKVIKDTKIDFHEYILRVFENVLKTGIIYLILQIGINALVFIFFDLILESSYSMLKTLEKVQIILNGLYLLPMVLLSVTKVEKECSKIIKNIVSYISIPLISIVYIIVYMYILKIIIKNEMPRNTIFLLTSGIFAISYFTWTISYKMNNNFITKISKIMPIVFIPLLILQTYSLLLRIIPYGITEQRYIGIMVLTFEIFAIIFSLIKQRKHEINIILVIIGILIVSFVMPLINIEDLSKFSQEIRPKEELKNEEITEQEDNSDYLLNGTTNEYEKYNNINYYSNSIESQNGFTIPEGYKIIKTGQCYTEETNNREEEIEYTKTGIKEEKLKNATTTYKECNVNIYDYTKKLIEINKQLTKIEVDYYIRENPILKTNKEDIDFYITGVQISYIEDEELLNEKKELPKMKNVIYNGYFLYK